MQQTVPASPAELLARVEELSARAEQLDDPQARDLAAELVSAVIAMYGDGLERIVAVIRDSREAGATILDELSQDGAVASLLLIHDLYPVGLRERVLEALETVRPYMESHGGDVELVELTEEGVALLSLQGSCHGCSASRASRTIATIRSRPSPYIATTAETSSEASSRARGSSRRSTCAESSSTRARSSAGATPGAGGALPIWRTRSACA